MKLKETEKKTIEVKCKGAANLSVDVLSEFQGNLKTLSEENYQRLKNQIIEHGFSAPFLIWVNGEKNNILDGHQRLTTVKRMRDEEGYVIPKLPVVYVEADDEKQAKKKILGLVSQYGDITFEGLDEFIKKIDLDITELTANFKLPDINIPSFTKYLEGPSEKDYSDNNEEIDTETFGDDLNMKCPRCNFEFSMEITKKK